MPEFACRVATSAGEVIERNYDAENESALRRELDSQNLMVLDVRLQNAAVQQLAGMFRLRRKVSSREFLLFNQELVALIKAGLPILGSLDILLERRENPIFRGALTDIRARVKNGESLSDAFSAQGDLFPSLYASTLASGERSGELASVIKRYIEYAHRVLVMRRKVVSALIYPSILVVLATVLISVMIFFIIPKFNDFLVGFGSDLPMITKIVVGIAMFCTDHWLLIVGGLVGGFVGVTLWNRSASGRLAIDGLLLKLPLVGGILRNYAQNRYTRTLGTLQSGGIPMVTALELAGRAVGNTVYEQALLKVVGKVREGQPLWESLAETGLISDLVIQMIKVGESTGALDAMLHDSSDFVDEEIETQLTRLETMIEPLMLVFMAFVVGIMLMSIYLPMIQAYGSAGS